MSQLCARTCLLQQWPWHALAVGHLLFCARIKPPEMADVNNLWECEKPKASSSSVAEVLQQFGAHQRCEAQ